MRLRDRAATLVVSSSMLLALALPVTAVHADEPKAPVDDSEFDSIVALTDVEETKLATADPIVDSVSDEDVAGAWIDPDSGRLVVGIIDENSIAEIRQDLASAGIGNATFEVVDYSQEALDQIVENMHDAPGLDSISSATHDYENNRVLVTTETGLTDQLRISLFELYGEAVAISPTPMVINDTTRQADSSPFYAGAWYGDYGGSSAYCTLGYSWLTGSNNPRMLTAGHCALQATIPEPVATNATSGYNYRVGTVIESTVNGAGTVGADGDLAIINTNIDGLGRSGAPSMWTGAFTSSTHTLVKTVDKWTSNSTDVCYSGRLTGVQCDGNSDGQGGFNVVDKDAWYHSSNTGRDYFHIAEAHKPWGQCPRPGDSGAPVYINTPGVGVAAHGILSGSGGGGDDGYVAQFTPSYCTLFFTEIGQAYDHWPSGHVEVSP